MPVVTPVMIWLIRFTDVTHVEVHLYFIRKQLLCIFSHLRFQVEFWFPLSSDSAVSSHSNISSDMSPGGVFLFFLLSSPVYCLPLCIFLQADELMCPIS